MKDYIGTPLYLRDLKEELQEDMKKNILRKRPDLKAHMDTCGDIAIGEYYRSEDQYAD